MEYAIGIDIGGTNVRAGIVARDGRIISKAMMRVGKVATAGEMVALMGDLVANLQQPKQGDIVGIGCGMPGIMDSGHGVIGHSPNFPEWKEVPFKSMIEKQFGTEVLLDNDANMCAVGEHRWGAAKKWDDFIMITLGTGLGGGIIVDGGIVQGMRGYAGEVGHMVIEREGWPCGCGSHGCWEQYASSHFFKRRGLGGHEAEAMAKKGNRAAKEIWREFGQNVGIGINNLMNNFGITNFVVGGGLARAMPLFQRAMKAEIKTRAYPQNYAKFKVKQSTLIDDAGVLGSAGAFFEMMDWMSFISGGETD
jgi:glucokinase